MEIAKDTLYSVTHYAKTVIFGTKRSTATEEQVIGIKALAEMKRVETETIFEIAEVDRETIKQRVKP